jgi:TatD DNase family protein
MELIDIGINLTHASYSADRDQILARAAAAGVVQMVVTGATLESSREAIDLAAAHPGRLAATAGVHPHHAAELGGDSLAPLRALALRDEVVAIGECGLDYFRDIAPRPVQQAAFARQLELAASTAKPVFLHQRDAHEDFLAILREHAPRLRGGVAHCFTGTGPQLDAYLELGLHIGITGWICDERRGSGLKAIVPHIPADRLMIETDGPYLLPRDLVPKPASRRNEPAFLPHIARIVAQARGESTAELAASTTRAARRLFGLPTEMPSV